VKYLLPLPEKIRELINLSGRILLLSDFDGTLSQIAPTPESAKLNTEIRNILIEIVSNPRFTTAIISGRSLEDLKSKVSIDGLIYAGNHGLEIEGPGLKYINPQALALKPAMKEIKQELNGMLHVFPGSAIEDKGLSLSVHYRLLEAEKEQKLKSVIESIVWSFPESNRLKLAEGKKVFEIRPDVKWDKGAAVRMLIEIFKEHCRPIFLGDDLTDEDGFKAIKEYGKGLCIYIGDMRGKSEAEYYLNNTGDVARFLKMLTG